MDGFNNGGQTPAYGNERRPLCSCGYADGANHILGEGTCCRIIATGILIPNNFRMEVWTSYVGTEHEKTFLTEVCEVNGHTITKYTLTDQRGYSYNEEFGIWSLPRNRESTNSLPDET